MSKDGDSVATIDGERKFSARIQTWFDHPVPTFDALGSLQKIRVYCDYRHFRQHISVLYYRIPF